MRSVVVAAVITIIACALALAACAPTVDGPAERAHAQDREDGSRLANALHDITGVVAVHPELHHAVKDPFTNTETHARALVLVIVDDQADASAITTTATELVHAMVPEASDPKIVVEVGEHRPTMAHVGPFTVDARTKSWLAGVLVAGLAIIALLAGYIAWRARPST